MGHEAVLRPIAPQAPPASKLWRSAKEGQVARRLFVASATFASKGHRCSCHGCRYGCSPPPLRHRTDCGLARPFVRRAAHRCLCRGGQPLFSFSGTIRRCLRQHHVALAWQGCRIPTRSVVAPRHGGEGGTSALNDAIESACGVGLRPARANPRQTCGAARTVGRDGLRRSCGLPLQETETAYRFRVPWMPAGSDEISPTAMPRRER